MPPPPDPGARTDPVKLAEAARLLLATGRPGTAKILLEQLPGAIETAVTQVAGLRYLEGRADAERIRRQRTAARARRRPTRLDWLKTKLVDQESRARVLAALRFDDTALARVLDGRAVLSGSQWRRL